MNHEQERTLKSSETMPLMRLLAIDTSMATLSVALLNDQRVLALTEEQGERNHSVRLVPIIQELLQSQGIHIQELDGIATGVGPGSYTGVRIGVTVAKTIAWSLNIPLFGVSSLAALALNAIEQTESSNNQHGYTWIIPLMNARRNQGYTALFTDQQQSMEVGERAILKRLVDDGIHPMEDWLIHLGEKLHTLKDRGEPLPSMIQFVGDVEPFEAMLLQFAEDVLHEIKLISSHVSATMVGKLAQHQWQLGITEDVHSLVPNYTQLAEAEVKLKARLAEQAKTGDGR